MPKPGLPGDSLGPEPLAIYTRLRLASLVSLAGAFLAACAPTQTFIENTPSMLEPRGPAAGQAAFLWWVFFILGTLIYLGVMGFLVIALRRRQKAQEPDLNYTGRNLILWAGIVMPTIVLLVLFGLTLRAMAVDTSGNEDSLTIEVIGRQWWWEVHYTDHQFFTANELHIPTGQPVEIKLRSEDVIHSFWVPQLSGKLDTNPGRTNTLWMQADQPGEYWGECAEFCGVQHAKMQFVVVAEEPEVFAAWLASQIQPSTQPADPVAMRGQEVFLDGSCIYCHTVRGTHATGELGPDLTHLASRLTLGAGAIANNRGALAGWVADPHSIKPGNKMPPIENMSSEDFQALLAYLQSLE